MAANGVMATASADSDILTRTPQNTPLNAAPISSRAQQPGVATINEGKDLSVAEGYPAASSVALTANLHQLQKISTAQPLRRYLHRTRTSFQ